MSDYTPEKFAQDLQQDVLARSHREGDGEGAFEESIFTELMIDYLGEAGELDDAAVCHHRAIVRGVGGGPARAIQVNGYALNETEECLDLLVTVYRGAGQSITLQKDDVMSAFKRVTAFYDKGVSGLYTQLEESAPVYDLAQRINVIHKGLTQIRVVLLTDMVVKTPPPKGMDAASARITFSIWDMERLYRLVSSGRQREPIEIDFQSVLGYPIPCLSQVDASPDYATYLAIFPGKVIVELYGRYGPRLLERNVRSFLQAKGKVNTGIRQTILKEPHMFLAFNNGLSGTAEAIETVPAPGGGIGISKLKDLQIVNGGQTTASIFHAVKKDKSVDIERIAVQVKLTVLKDLEQMDSIVPRISEYANSQNKVQTADFAANDAFHRRMEALSREIWAPAKDGTARQTHWFYERARGQYRDELMREATPGRQAEFRDKNPTDQLFTKTDLAKFLQTWDQKPNVVSKGAQACFNDFMARLGDHVEAERNLDARYYERVVAKAILFKTAESLIGAEIRKREEKLGGYRAALVTYTLAKIVHDTNGIIDLSAIYKQQCLPDTVREAILTYWLKVYERIFAGARGGNFTQYCKQEGCWQMVRESSMPVPHSLVKEIHGATKTDADVMPSVKRRQLSKAVDEVVQIPPEVWLKLADWGTLGKKMSGLDRHNLCEVATKLGYGEPPTQRRSEDALRLLKTALDNGFQP